MMQSNIFAKVVPLLRELKFECAFDRLEFFFTALPHWRLDLSRCHASRNRFGYQASLCSFRVLRNSWNRQT